MKVIVACDSYKGCMSSKQVAEQICAGIHEVDSSIEVTSYVIGDGGEGTIQAFCETMNGEYVKVATSDAYGRKIQSEYALIEDGKTAVIEVANIIGLSMHPREKRAPLHAGSFGVGTVILDAVSKGCTKIIVGLGGSATNDCGIGLLQCLGARFYDANHKYLSPQAMNLEKVRYIDFHRLNTLEGIELIAACDVKNHLLGEQGATHVFGRQKGLSLPQIHKLEQGMENFCYQIKRYKEVDLNSFEGGGAAGGLGAIFMGLLHAKMESGIRLLLSYGDIEKQIQDCDLVITGEGQSDAQTLFGKVPMGVLEVAKRYQKPCICISGALGIGYQKLYDAGFVAIFSIADRAMSFLQALEQAPDKLKNATIAIIKTICYFRKS